MALIHKTKKEEGKKHKTKKKTQKKQKIFRIELRKDRFRMFGPYSKPISAISVASRYSPILAESAPFGANRSRISANPRERERERGKKKKKLRRGTDAPQSGAVPSQPRQCFKDKHPQCTQVGYFFVNKIFCYLSKNKLKKNHIKLFTGLSIFFH